MQPQRIVRADDERIAAFQAVADPELVRRRGQFIAEGRLVVRRVIEDARYRVRSVLVNDAALTQMSDALTRLDGDAPVYVCDTRVLVNATGYNLHRGCLAIVDRPTTPSLEDVIAGGRTLVVLEAVANADNVGAIFRNAAAFGADAVVLSPRCCDPYYRKAVRTSMGAVMQVPFAFAEPWPDAIEIVRREGFTLAALTPRSPAVSLDGFARTLPRRVALLLGAEGDGLSRAAESMADVRVRIPITDAVDSLNVATAAAVALYAASRRE